MEIKNWGRMIGLVTVMTAMTANSSSLSSRNNEISDLFVPEKAEINPIKSLYKDMNLDTTGIRYEVFDRAYNGYQILKKNSLIDDPSKLTIIDYTLPNTEKRMWIIDLEKKELLEETVAMHGIKSGKKYAKNFSNKKGSNQSSLGFAVTVPHKSKIYDTSVGLKGLEKTNSNLWNRGIVIHESKYAGNPRSYSEGCPAVPLDNIKKIKDILGKGGSIVYLHHDKLLSQDYQFLENKNYEMFADNSRYKK